jgi:hypothetical protein
VALCVVVCVAYVLLLRVGSGLMLSELEIEAQDEAEAQYVGCMELLEDWVLLPDKVKTNEALCVSTDGELVTETLLVAEMLGESECVGHWLSVSEAVAEWQALVALEELQVPLSVCVREAYTLALEDAVMPRLLLGQGEADVEELLLRVTLEHCEAVAEATLLPLKEPRGEGEGVGVCIPEEVAEAHGEADSPRVALGLPDKPLLESAGERVPGEAVSDTLLLVEKLSESDCVGHWLAEGESVEEGLSQGEREVNPLALSGGSRETLALALSDAKRL